MRCNPSLWLLGLVPIAMLSWIAVQLEHEGIENDLARRTEDALHRTGLDWADANFNGRDGIVTGTAVEDRGPQRALALVRNVWGVRIAYNRSGLVQRVDKFIWSAKAETNGRLTLSGDVPSEQARKSLVDTARAEFPKAAVADNMRLARGAIDRDDWLRGATFSLKNFAKLKAGEAELSALDLSMTGEAPTSDAYRRVRAALATQRPAGVNLAREKITLPIARPYTWSAKKTGDQVAIAGFAPSDEDRARTASRAKTLFAKATVSDFTDLADGAPDGWGKAVSVALDQLGLLKTGEAAFRDKELTFIGEATDEQAASAVRRTLKLDVPQNFKIIDRIRYPRPDLPAPGSGYVMGIVNDGSALEVIGMIPSEATRVALVDAVKARFPGRSVTDKTQVAPGAPDGWQQCVVAGLASLPRLKSGKSMLTNRKLEVSGETDDYAAAQSVPNDVKAAAGQSCEATTNIKFTGQLKTDLTWNATRDASGLVTLEGEAPDDPSRTRLVDTARQIYAGSSIADHMKIVGASARALDVGDTHRPRTAGATAARRRFDFRQRIDDQRRNRQRAGGERHPQRSFYRFAAGFQRNRRDNRHDCRGEGRGQLPELNAPDDGEGNDQFRTGQGGLDARQHANAEGSGRNCQRVSGLQHPDRGPYGCGGYE